MRGTWRCSSATLPRRGPATAGDWVFVAAVVALVVVIAVVPLVVLYWIVPRVGREFQWALVSFDASLSSTASPQARVFLLSPANCGGTRASRSSRRGAVRARGCPPIARAARHSETCSRS